MSVSAFMEQHFLHFNARETLDAAKAYVKQVQVQISKTKIHAPFDAVVDDKRAEIGDYLEPQTAILTLVDEDPYLVHAQMKKPLGLDDLQTLVHQGGGINGYFRSHVPVGMVEGLGRCDIF